MAPVEMPSSTAVGEKPCRTCVDFKTWMKQQRKNVTTTSSTAQVEIPKDVPEAPSRTDCPLDKDSLGRSTWGLLHTMAAFYPEKPEPQQERDVKSFYLSLSRTYPCEHCAEDLRKELKASPPETSSANTLSQWLCRLHNTVNVKIGKPEFDCSKVNQRWRDGWLDGSCDE